MSNTRKRMQLIRSQDYAAEWILLYATIYAHVFNFFILMPALIDLFYQVDPVPVNSPYFGCKFIILTVSMTPVLY